MDKLRIGIINISDRASRGEYEDLPGQAAREWLDKAILSPWQCEYAVVPDEQDQIEAKLIQFADTSGCCLIVTTGGTGPALRDVTPEATEAVCDKIIPGFGEQMRRESLKHVPTAILSRQTAGVRGKCLIFNLPGRPKAIAECLEAVFAAIPTCTDLLVGVRLEVDPEVVQAVRPKQN